MADRHDGPRAGEPLAVTRAARAVAGRPAVTIHMTRDSVAMGDDIDAPHARVVEVPAVTDPVALVNRLYPGYLAGVCGVMHSWSCLLNGHRIATIKGNGRCVQATVEAVAYEAENHVHFVYHAAAW